MPTITVHISLSTNPSLAHIADRVLFADVVLNNSRYNRQLTTQVGDRATIDAFTAQITEQAASRGIPVRVHDETLD